MATESRNRQRPLRTLIIFFAFMAALFAIMALSGAWAPKLGLDLRGGTTITLTARNVTGAGAVDAASLEQARTIIQQRVDSIGVGESEVATVGNNQVQVSVPNVAPAQLQEMVGQTAQLFFRPVHSEEAVQAAVQPTDPATTAAPGDGTAPADTAAPADTTAPADGTPTDETSPAVNRRPAPGLPTPAATPRPTEPAAVQPTTEEALAWTPTSQDLADYAAFTCGDEFPDVTDQPLITCDREGTAIPA